MTHRRHNIAFNSNQRDPIKYPSHSNYKITLEEDLNKVLSARIITAEIPKTQYNVSCHNSCFTIAENVEGVITEYELCIPQGDYDACSLTTEIGNLLSTGGLTNTYTINIINGKLCIESTDRFELKFKDTSSADRLVDNSTQTGKVIVNMGKCSEYCGISCMKGSARSLMGFNIDNYIAIENDDTSLWSVKSPNKVNLIGDKVVYIHITTNTTRLEHIESRSQGANGAFARIPLNAQQNNVVFYRNIYESMEHWVACAPLERIRSFNIELRTEDGRLYNTCGIPWCFSLEVLTGV